MNLACVKARVGRWCLCARNIFVQLLQYRTLFFFARAHGLCAAIGHLLAMGGHGCPPERLITKVLVEMQLASWQE